jgi:hypothetical protein
MKILLFILAFFSILSCAAANKNKNAMSGYISQETYSIINSGSDKNILISDSMR